MFDLGPFSSGKYLPPFTTLFERRLSALARDRRDYQMLRKRVEKRCIILTKDEKGLLLKLGEGIGVVEAMVVAAGRAR